MSFVTRLSLKNLTEAERKRVLDVCHFCAHKDETFKYQVKGDFVEIDSLSRNQAFKRGSYFHIKFPKIFYNVERVREVAESE